MKPDTLSDHADQSAVLDTASALPFECDNCGYKPTLREVLDNKGDCPKCRDTVIAYTVEACRMFHRWIDRPVNDDAEIEEMTLATVSEHVESAIAQAEGAGKVKHSKPKTTNPK